MNYRSDEKSKRESMLTHAVKIEKNVTEATLVSKSHVRQSQCTKTLGLTDSKSDCWDI